LKTLSEVDAKTFKMAKNRHVKTLKMTDFPTEAYLSVVQIDLLSFISSNFANEAREQQ
jgi:hypothetical protein